MISVDQKGSKEKRNLCITIAWTQNYSLMKWFYLQKLSFLVNDMIFNWDAADAIKLLPLPAFAELCSNIESTKISASRLVRGK